MFTCDPCFQDNCFFPDTIGPKSCRGAIGATGATGATGPAFNTYGSFYDPEAQVITTGIPVSLTSTISANNISLTGDSVFIPATGTYLIGYGINAAPDAVAGNNIFLAVNGTPVAGTERAISVSAETNSTAILNLLAGQFLSIMPTAVALSVTNTGGPSANLNITRIA